MEDYDFSDMTAGANLACLDMAPEPEPLHTLMSMVTDWIWRANRPWREPTAVELALHATSTPEYVSQYLTRASPPSLNKAYALKNITPCTECGKYSFHLIDCERAKKMDAMFRNYIPKSWEPDAPQLCTCDASPSSWPVGYKTKCQVHKGTEVNLDSTHDEFVSDQGVGEGWCPICKHHRGNHIDFSGSRPPGLVGCVLAGCDCKRNPKTITPEVEIDPLTQEPVCEAGFTTIKPGQRLGLIDEHGKLCATIQVAKTSKPFTLTTRPWRSP